MATADQEVTTSIVLTLTADEASLLYRALNFITIKDASFEDEDEYDATAEKLVDIVTALADVGVRDGEYNDVEFEIV